MNLYSNIANNKYYDLFVYHKNCFDGTSASWVYWNIIKKEDKLDQVDFRPSLAGQFPEDINFSNKYVLIADLCFSMKKLEELSPIVKELIIIDHHKSAMQEFIDYFDINSSNTKWEILFRNNHSLTCRFKNILVIFDMNYCGAELTWNFFHKADETRPWFFQVIRDRDLWLWQDSRSKALSTFMSQKDLITWNGLENLVNANEDEINSMYQQGLQILELENIRLEKIANKAVLTELITPETLIKYKVYLLGQYEYISELGNILSKKEECDFAAIYRYDFISNCFHISLRANKENIDVSIIAREFNGGGHAKSSAFSVPNTEEGLKKYFKVL